MALKRIGKLFHKFEHRIKYSMKEKGTISIHSENIFPIIKKFLYSDHEIFLRELVANAVDATQKLKRLSSLGELPGDIGDDLRIEVEFNKNVFALLVMYKRMPCIGYSIGSRQGHDAYLHHVSNGLLMYVLPKGACFVVII